MPGVGERFFSVIIFSRARKMFELICFQNPLPVPEFVCKTKTVLQIRFEHPLHPLGHSEPQGHELEHSALSRLQLDTQVVSPSQALSRVNSEKIPISVMCQRYH